MSFQLYELQIFTRCFASLILHFLVKHSWDRSRTNFCHQQCLLKIILTEQALCPQCWLSAAYWLYDFWIPFFQQVSLQTVPDGRSEPGSSPGLLLPWQKSAAQYLTMAYDGIYPLCTTVIPYWRNCLKEQVAAVQWLLYSWLYSYGNTIISTAGETIQRSLAVGLSPSQCAIWTSRWFVCNNICDSHMAFTLSLKDAVK